MILFFRYPYCLQNYFFSFVTNIVSNSIIWFFLSILRQIYRRLCRSIGQSVHPSIYLSISPSINWIVGGAWGDCNPSRFDVEGPFLQLEWHLENPLSTDLAKFGTKRIIFLSVPKFGTQLAHPCSTSLDKKGHRTRW